MTKEDKLIVAAISLLFLFAAILNFDALYQFARDDAGIKSSLAWLVPVLIDLFIAIAVWITFRNERYGESSRLAWSVVVLFTVGSIFLNSLHYPMTAGGLTVAVMVPLSVFLSAEFGKGVIGSSVRRFDMSRTTIELNDQMRSLAQERDMMTAQIEHVTVQEHANGHVKLSERQDEIVELYHRGNKTQEEVAELLKVSVSTVRREWAEIKDKLNLT